MNRRPFIHLLIWAIVLMAFWLLLSGFLKPLLIAFGVVSVALVVVLLRRMDAADEQPQTPALGLSFWRYGLWLSGQILLSSIEVAKLVWSKKGLSPTMAKLPISKVAQKNRVLYANSITLTPGTLSVDIDDDEVTVHALNKQSIADLKAGGMAKKIADVMGDKY
ncbi:MAG TPA: hypothetical protein DE179_06120 [Oceanospirillaceae bacterium]|nr:hypothetical protein [Oceanospirillaceae bacterium]